MREVIIVGAGVIGASIARELSKYTVDVLVLEKNNEVSNMSSKANTAIIHSGYDPIPGTNMARLNVLGNKMYDELAKDLGFPFRRNGSMIVANNEEELKHLELLLDRAKQNGVQDIKIITGDEARALEPNLADEIKYVLHAKTGAIVSPWQLTENLCENAAENGVEFRLSEEVLNIEKKDDKYIVYTNKGYYESKLVINAAGLYADKINELLFDKSFTITPVKGEYLVYSVAEGSKVNSTVFQVPTSAGKGVLVTPTAHGHLIIGPTTEAVERAEDISTTDNGLNYLKEKYLNSVKNIDISQPIREYVGVRANSDKNDFIIEDNGGFITVGAIKSPGLSSAPAIALDVVNMVNEHISLEKNNNFNPTRRAQQVLYTKAIDNRDEYIKNDPDFGELICRFEKITKGDMLNIINRKLGATTLNGIKRRTRAGASPAQMVFSMPKTIKILSDRFNIPQNEILLDDNGSYVLTKKAKLQPKYTDVSYENKKIEELSDKYDVIVIGGGLAGLEAAKNANYKGYEKVLVVEMDSKLGGTYATLLEHESSFNKVNNTLIQSLIVDDIDYITDTALFELDKDNMSVDILNRDGYKKIFSKKIILAMGSYEKNRENIEIAGTRPAGIFNPLQTMRLFNYNKYMMGNEFVLYGINKYMLSLAKRLILEGAKIKALVLENDVLADKYSFFKEQDIPIFYNTKVIEIKGKNRLEEILLSNNTSIYCDTLVFAKGYVADNMLTKSLGIKLTKNDKIIVDNNGETNIKNIYAVGAITE